MVPCRNYGQYLGEAIASALAQTYPPDRVVVVDDGSTDNTAEVAKSFAPAVDYRRSRHVGQTKIRNFGLRDVDSDFVVFLDADDVLDPTFIEKCVAALVAAPSASFAYTQYRRFGLLDDDVEVESHFPTWSVPRLLSQNYITATALLPTELIRRYGYDPRIKRAYGDWDLYLTLAEEGYEGVLVDEPLLHYRRHTASLQWAYSRDEATRERLRAYLAIKHWRLRGRRAAFATGGRHMARSLKLTLRTLMRRGQQQR